jgi:hypothetical protein
MLTILIIAVGTLMVSVLVLLVVVVVGIRREPATGQLTREASDPIAAFVRHFIGVYVRRPDPRPVPDGQETTPYTV